MVSAVFEFVYIKINPLQSSMVFYLDLRNCNNQTLFPFLIYLLDLDTFDPADY